MEPEDERWRGRRFPDATEEVLYKVSMRVRVLEWNTLEEREIDVSYVNGRLMVGAFDEDANQSILIDIQDILDFCEKQELPLQRERK